MPDLKIPHTIRLAKDLSLWLRSQAKLEDRKMTAIIERALRREKRRGEKRITS